MDGMVYWLRDRVTRCTSDAPEMITNRPTRWIMLQFLCLQMCVTVQRDDMHHGSIGWYNVEMIVCSHLLSGWKRKVKKPRFKVQVSQIPALNYVAFWVACRQTRSMSTPRQSHLSGKVDMDPCRVPTRGRYNLVYSFFSFNITANCQIPLRKTTWRTYTW